MAKAFRCDRDGCDRVEPGDPIAGVTFNLPNLEAAPGSSSRRMEAKELCSVCLQSLYDWLASGGADARG